MEIKQFLNKIKKPSRKTWLVFGVILVVFFVFYWWQVRPAQIRSKCAKWAVEVNAIPGDPSSYDTAGFKNSYPYCLHKNGL